MLSTIQLREHDNDVLDLKILSKPKPSYTIVKSVLQFFQRSDESGIEIYTSDMMASSIGSYNILRKRYLVCNLRIE